VNYWPSLDMAKDIAMLERSAAVRVQGPIEHPTQRQADLPAWGKLMKKDRVDLTCRACW
jgi:hypothetical protein